MIDILLIIVGLIGTILIVSRDHFAKCFQLKKYLLSQGYTIVKMKRLFIPPMPFLWIGPGQSVFAIELKLSDDSHTKGFAVVGGWIFASLTSKISLTLDVDNEDKLRIEI